VDDFHDIEPQSAISAVQLPAAFLLALGVLGLGASLLSLVFLSFAGMSPTLPPDVPPEQAKMVVALSSGLSWVLYAGSALASLVVVAGSISLLRRRSRPLGIAACIAAMLNPVLCCCVPGLGVGIWGLVVLSRPEVAAAFDAAGRERAL